MRNSFIFYRSYFEAIDNMPLEEQVVLYRALVCYALDSKEIELKGANKSIFTLIKPTLDNSIKQYENGSKGGRPKKITTIEKTQTKPNNNPTHNPLNTNTNINPNPNTNLDINPNLVLNTNSNVEREINNKELVEELNGLGNGLPF